MVEGAGKYYIAALRFREFGYFDDCEPEQSHSLGRVAG